MTRMATTVYLGLGSNLGTRAQHLQRAVAELEREGLRVRRASRVWAGPYVGPGEPQPEYMNAALQAETHLPPLALLDVLRRLEARCGRLPGTHLLPRPLDVDILFYGGWTIRHPELVVPHPRLGTRRFVLEPLNEIAVLDELAWPGLVQRLDIVRQEQALELRATLRLDEDRLEAWA